MWVAVKQGIPLSDPPKCLSGRAPKRASSKIVS